MPPRRPVCLLQNRTQYGALRAAGIDATRVVCELDLHYQLTAEGVEHTTCWQLADLGGFAAATERAERLNRAWLDIFDPPILVNGVDVMRMAPTRQPYFFGLASWWAHVAGRVFDAIDADELIALGPMRGHGLWQPVRPYHEVLKAVAAGEALRRRWRVRHLRLPDADEPWSDLAAPQAQPRSTPRSGTTVGTDLRAPARARFGFQRGQRRPRVLVVGANVDIVHQAELVTALSADGSLDMVHLALTLDQPFAGRTAELGLTPVRLDDLAPPVVPQRADHAVVAAARRRFGERRGCDPILASPLLDAHFDFMLGPHLRSMIGHVRRWRRLLKEMRPDLIVTCYDYPMLAVARAAGIDVLSCSHGGFPEARYLGLPANHAAAWGEPMAGALRQAGLDDEHIHRIGSSSFDRLFATAASTSREAACIRFGLNPGRPVIVLLHARIDSDLRVCASIDGHEHLNTWLALRDLSDRHPDWQIVLKTHPRMDHWELLAGLFAAQIAAGRVSLPRQARLDQVVPAADVVLSVNVSSGSILESLVWPVPVGLIATATDWHRDPTVGLADLPTLDSIAAAERWIARCLIDPSFRAAQVAAGRRVLTHHIGPADGRAAQRLAEVVSRLARRSSENTNCTDEERMTRKEPDDQ